MKMIRVNAEEGKAAQQGPQRIDSRRWLCRLKQHGPQQQMKPTNEDKGEET
jgi:hypothetical protein